MRNSARSRSGQPQAIKASLLRRLRRARSRACRSSPSVRRQEISPRAQAQRTAHRPLWRREPPARHRLRSRLRRRGCAWERSFWSGTPQSAPARPFWAPPIFPAQEPEASAYSLVATCCRWPGNSVSTQQWAMAVLPRKLSSTCPAASRWMEPEISTLPTVCTTASAWCAPVQPAPPFREPPASARESSPPSPATATRPTPATTDLRQAPRSVTPATWLWTAREISILPTAATTSSARSARPLASSPPSPAATRAPFAVQKAMRWVTAARPRRLRSTSRRASPSTQARTSISPTPATSAFAK